MWHKKTLSIRGLVTETRNLGMPFPLFVEDPIGLSADTYNQRKEILTHWKNAVDLFPVLILQVLLVTRAKSLTVGTVSISMFSL